MLIPRALTIYIIFVAAGCATQKPASDTQKGYSEDLSVLRPSANPNDSIQTDLEVQKKTQYVAAQYDINKPLEEVLDSIDRINLSRKYIDGFTIQVYSGQDREAALNAKKLLTTSLPLLNSEIQYTQPNFRVRAGNYYNRLDAQKDFVLIRKHFPNAIISPSRIEMNGDD
jgi:SPOR domain